MARLTLRAAKRLPDVYQLTWVRTDGTVFTQIVDQATYDAAGTPGGVTRADAALMARSIIPIFDTISGEMEDGSYTLSYVHPVIKLAGREIEINPDQFDVTVSGGKITAIPKPGTGIPWTIRNNVLET